MGRNLRQGSAQERAIMHLRKFLMLSAMALAALGGESFAFGQSNCTTPPDPTKTFLQNFLNSCYAFTYPVMLSNGQNAGDLTETYAGFF